MKAEPAPLSGALTNTTVVALPSLPALSVAVHVSVTCGGQSVRGREEVWPGGKQKHARSWGIALSLPTQTSPRAPCSRSRRKAAARLASSRLAPRAAEGR
jgi:hypothetical protein